MLFSSSFSDARTVTVGDRSLTIPGARMNTPWHSSWSGKAEVGGVSEMADGSVLLLDNAGRWSLTFDSKLLI